MQIDRDKVMNFIVFVLDQLENFETELLIYRSVCHGLQSTGHDVDHLLELGKHSPLVQEVMNRKYGAIRQKLTTQCPEGELNQLLSDFLTYWKPENI